MPRDLPALLQSQNPKMQINVGIREYETYDRIIPSRKGNFTAWIAISRGCNNWCSYCIVPIVRGAERSRNPQEVKREVENFVKLGGKEVTLLGQNVSTYNWQDWSFNDLLHDIAKVDGLQRLRFVTNHPRDINLHLFELMAAINVICPFLHMPIQSGSDKILKAMNRGYTQAEYLKKVILARHLVPGIHIATDIIVGFPGESDEDFQETIRVIKEAQFEMAYVFMYNPRPGTKAAELRDDVSRELKVERLKTIVDLINKQSLTVNMDYLDKEIEVLLESTHPHKEGYLIGRSPGNVLVNVEADTKFLGEIKKIKITRVGPHSLNGYIA
jgi:tRNA-2-methylthio-N6-dimethylallyladenosine synthase